MNSVMTGKTRLAALLAGLFLSTALLRAETVTIFVDTLQDEEGVPPQAMTLRKAIVQANASASPDAVQILFRENLANPGILNLSRPLPALTRNGITIDGMLSPTDVRRVRIVMPYRPDQPIQAIFSIASASNVITNVIVGGGNNIGFLVAGSTAAGNRFSRCAVGYDPDNVISAQTMLLAYGFIVKSDAKGNAIGLSAPGSPGAGNLVANCSLAGIVLEGAGGGDNTILGNIVGSPDETLLCGNRMGVMILDCPNNVVGGASSAYGNVIRGNALNGILVEGPNAVSNYLGKNSFYNNGLMGIDLSRSRIGDGPGRISDNRTHPGPNNFLPAPSLISYTCSTLQSSPKYQFRLQGRAYAHAAVEVYEASPHPSGFGEGKVFLAETTTDADGNFYIELLRDSGVLVTMLCRHQSDTSEFSYAVDLSTGLRRCDVQAVQAWQSTFLLPVGFEREMGFSLSRAVGPNATTSIDIQPHDPSFVSAPDYVDVPSGAIFGAFPITTLKPGLSDVVLKTAENLGGTSSGVRIFSDKDEPLDLLPEPTTLERSLDGAANFRFFRIYGNAGEVVNVSVTSADTSLVDPVISIFGRFGPPLTSSNDYDGSRGAFAQATLPENGTYFIAVGDLFRRLNTSSSFTMKTWKGARGLTQGDSFHAQPAFPTDSRPGRMTLGDLNGDGYDDAIVALPEQNRLLIRLKVPGADAAFQPPGHQELAFSPTVVNVADLNGDDRLDIVVAGANPSELIVLYNTGNFESPPAGKQTAFTPAARVSAAAGGDVGATLDANGDAYSDYALLSSTSGQLQIFLNDKLGNLCAQSTFAAGVHPLSLAVGDFDADGNADLAVADNAANQINLFEGQGDGSFVSHTVLSGFPAPVDLKTADIDQDGIQDLVSISETTGGLKSWLGQGAFNFLEFQELASGDKPNSLVLSDINGDGLKDAAVSCTTSQDVYIYEGAALGLFIPAARLSESGEIEQIFWYSFGITGSYIGVSPSTQFIQVLQQSYAILDFPGAQTEDNLRAAFAFANPSSTDAVVTLSLYNPDGSLIVDERVTNPITATVAAGQQAAFYLENFFGAAAASYQPYLRACSLNPALQGFFLKVDASSAIRMDGAVAVKSLSSRQVLPSPAHVAADADGVCTIANPEGEAVTVTAACRSESGSELGTPLVLAIPANGHTAFRFAESFPGAPPGCYLDLRAAKRFEAFLHADTSELVAALNGIPAPEASTDCLTKIVPHFAVGRIFRSAMDLVNTGDQQALVTVKALSDDGALIAQTAPLAIPAGGMLRGDVDVLLGLDSTSADVIAGFLQIVSDRAGVTGFLTFSDRQNGRVASSLPLQDHGGAKWMFSHVAVGELGGIRYFTGIAVLNAGTADATLQCKVYNSAGALQGQGDFLVPAGRKVSRMVTDFVPGLAAQAGGYVTLQAAEGTANIMTYEMFGDYDFRFLTAVAAQPLP